MRLRNLPVKPNRLRGKGAASQWGRCPVLSSAFSGPRRLDSLPAHPGLGACLLETETGVSSQENNLKAFPPGCFRGAPVPKWAAGRSGTSGEADWRDLVLSSARPRIPSLGGASRGPCPLFCPADLRRAQKLPLEVRQGQPVATVQRPVGG